VVNRGRRDTGRLGDLRVCRSVESVRTEAFSCGSQQTRPSFDGVGVARATELSRLNFGCHRADPASGTAGLVTHR